MELVRRTHDLNDAELIWDVFIDESLILGLKCFTADFSLTRMTEMRRTGEPSCRENKHVNKSEMVCLISLNELQWLKNTSKKVLQNQKLRIIHAQFH